MRMRNSTAVLIATSLVAMLATAGCATITSTSGPAPDTVTVVGTGTGSSAPDRATISMSVSAHARSAPGAMNSATTAMDRLVAVLKGVGLTDAELQTQQVSIYQQGGTPGGYQASQTLTVKTKHVSELGKILAEATRAEASDISGPQFSLADQDQVRAQAITRAMADAKSRAAVTAKAAGRALGRVVSVSEVVQTSGLGYQGMGYAGLAPSSVFAEKATIAPTVSPGRISVSAQLSVVFALQ